MDGLHIVAIHGNSRDAVSGGTIAEMWHPSEIEVPKRMSIMGFDDLGVETDRPLTTMRTDSSEVGRLAVRTLLDQIHGETSSQKRITVPTELVIRESTAPAYQEEEGTEQ